MALFAKSETGAINNAEMRSSIFRFNLISFLQIVLIQIEKIKDTFRGGFPKEVGGVRAETRLDQKPCLGKDREAKSQGFFLGDLAVKSLGVGVMDVVSVHQGVERPGI